MTAVDEWDISAEDSPSDHNFLKYKIGTASSYKNTYSYQLNDIYSTRG
jgi:hypothetical protein